MALSFLTTPIPRTTTATANPLITEGGKTQLHFLPPTSRYSMRVHIPPGPTIHDPPYHWHLHQIEHFHVEAGRARAVVDGVEKVVAQGGSFTIPARTYHTFYNGSTEEELVIDIGLDPASRARDEAFFRNLYSYQDDCLKAGREPSVAQLLRFLYMFDCVPALPGPQFVMRPIARILVWTLGVGVGKWLLGLNESYPEYYKVATK